MGTKEEIKMFFNPMFWKLFLTGKIDKLPDK